MKKTVAVTVYVDVEVSSGRSADCERVAKSAVIVSSMSWYGGINRIERAEASERMSTAVCVG